MQKKKFLILIILFLSFQLFCQHSDQEGEKEMLENCYIDYFFKYSAAGGSISLEIDSNLKLLQGTGDPTDFDIRIFGDYPNGEHIIIEYNSLSTPPYTYPDFTFKYYNGIGILEYYTNETTAFQIDYLSNQDLLGFSINNNLAQGSFSGMLEKGIDSINITNGTMSYILMTNIPVCFGIL